MLKKPWNPYIRRHSALTEKSRILKEHILRQHAGWTGNSQMPQKYLHFFGNESSESLLESYGIETKDQQLADALKIKQCPNCNESNKPDSRFCAKCRMVLTNDAYNETIENTQQKDDEIKTIKEQIQALILATSSFFDQAYSLLPFFGTTCGYCDLNSFFRKSNCGCPSNTRTATCYDCNFLICH
jgi:hypothetical protein